MKNTDCITDIWIILAAAMMIVTNNSTEMVNNISQKKPCQKKEPAVIHRSLRWPRHLVIAIIPKKQGTQAGKLGSMICSPAERKQ